MISKQLFLATRNKGKILELHALLADLPDITIISAGDRSDIPEPEETGADFLENARIKALEYARMTGLPALADDSGLVIDALGGLPGVRSARYAETEELRIRRVLEELKNTPAGSRSARFVCSAVFAEPSGVVAEVEGRLEGEIGFVPKGSNGFGYDPIFELTGTGKTLAELGSEEKNAISHRGEALRKMRVHLVDYFGR